MGLARFKASSARLNLADDTIFMDCVIFWMFFTDLSRVETVTSPVKHTRAQPHRRETINHKSKASTAHTRARARAKGKKKAYACSLRTLYGSATKKNNTQSTYSA